MLPLIEKLIEFTYWSGAYGVSFKHLYRWKSTVATIGLVQ